MGFYTIKNIRFSNEIPIYYDLEMLLKDLTDEELDILQEMSLPDNMESLKIGYKDNWFKYIASFSEKTIAAR